MPTGRKQGGQNRVTLDSRNFFAINENADGSSSSLTNTSKLPHFYVALLCAPSSYNSYRAQLAMSKI